jgi:hypothetical protein
MAGRIVRAYLAHRRSTARAGATFGRAGHLLDVRVPDDAGPGSASTLQVRRRHPLGRRKPRLPQFTDVRHRVLGEGADGYGIWDKPAFAQLVAGAAQIMKEPLRFTPVGWTARANGWRSSWSHMPN